jgi:hypothetical protein
MNSHKLRARAPQLPEARQASRIFL